MTYHVSMKINEIKTHEDLKKFIEVLFNNDTDFYAGYYRGYCNAMKWEIDTDFLYSLMDDNYCCNGIPL